MTASRPTRPPLPRPVWVLAAIAFCVAAGFGIVAPSIPTFAHSFGVSTAAAAAVVSVFAAVRLVSAPVAGSAVDRWGERPVLIAGLAIVAGSSALAGLSRTYPQLLALRGVGGFGSAMFSTSATALLLRLVPSEQRGRASGTFSGGFLLGGVSGPALGGVVTAISVRLPFFLYAGTLGAATVVAIVSLPSVQGRRVAARARGELTVRAFLRLPAYRAVLTANLADSWAAVGVRSALVPLLVTETLHQSPTLTGVGFALFSAANAAALPIAARLDDRGHRRALLVAGTGISAIGVTLLALPLTGGLALGVFVLSLLVFGGGSGLLDVAPAAILGDLLPPGSGGRLVSTYQMAGDVGTTAGPLIAGVVADAAGLRAGFAVTAVVLVVATATGARAAGTARRRLAQP